MPTIKGVVVSKQLVYDPTGTRYIKIDIMEEREIPGPIATFPAHDERATHLAREVVPILTQIIKSLPFGGGKIPVPRLTAWLTDEEAEVLGDIDVGDTVVISIEGGEVRVRREG
jgi:hypothetical protein